MKNALIAGILFFIGISVGNANTARDYILNEGQTVVIEYAGCGDDVVWLMNGVPQNWLSAQRGTPPNFPMWVIAISPEEVAEVLKDWFKPMPLVISESDVPEEWCVEQAKLLKDASI